MSSIVVGMKPTSKLRLVGTLWKPAKTSEVVGSQVGRATGRVEDVLLPLLVPGSGAASCWDAASREEMFKLVLAGAFTALVESVGQR